MSQELITTSNADRNIYAGATVLSATPDASNPRLCYVMVLLGDGTKNLSGAGGDFTVTITIAGNTWNGAAQTRTLGSAVRSLIQTEAFFVPANAAVTVAITSPNSADTDVDCTAYLVSESSAGAAGVADIQSRLPAALVSGRMDASVGAMAANTLTANALATDAVTEVQSGLPAAVLAAGDVDGYTLEQALKLMLAALAGKVSGAGTTTVILRAADDSKPRITATVETATGNRSALTLDATG